MPAALQSLTRREALRPGLQPPLDVAIVGATGAVGREMIACLERRRFPVAGLRLFASERSVGRVLPYRGERIAIEPLSETAFAGTDLVLFAADAETSLRFAPAAMRAGAVVIDNSSVFRMDPAAPLVVPEVNGQRLSEHQGLIANPNCCAVIAVMALGPLHAAVRVRRVIAATYQAASGAGAEAMDELRDSTSAYLHGRPYRPRVLAHPYAFNLFSHDSAVDPESGANGEELRIAQELGRLLDAPELLVGVTCVRVPVLRAHSIALVVELERPMAPEEALAILARAPGVRVVNDRAANRFPMPSEAAGREEVLVGRVRRDQSDPSGRSLSLFVAGDQLLKGAALNAVQIAERLIAASG
jgi:aspartate-semialdehyde dehydrogenase